MTHFEVNWIAVILAMVASMALGMAWYMSLGKQWMAALGKTEDEIKAGGGAVSPFIWAAGCQLVMAYFIAVLTPALMGSVDVYNGALTGAHMWLGFMATSMLLNHRYQGQKWSLALIDGGYLLGVALVQGVVIGLFG